MNGISHQLPTIQEKPALLKIIKELDDLKFALNQSSIVGVTDAAGRIIYANDQFSKTSKYSREELLGNTHRILNSGVHPKDFFSTMWKTIQSGHVWKGEICNKAKDGSYYWLDATIIPFLNKKGIPEQYISIRNDITDRKAMEEQVAFLAYYDELTSLPNRRKFNNDLQEKMQATKDNGSGLSVFFLDLDRFKQINDTKGHSFGDYVLRTVVTEMATQLEDKAQMYRLGGDEFTIIFENSSYQEVLKQANRLLDIFNSPFILNNEDFFLSLSMGVSVYPFHGEDIDSLVKSADIAMYRAKESGGNRIDFFTNDMIEEIKEEMSLEHDLRKAIDRDELHLVYQPKINLASGKMVGLEALIRWNHETIGDIPPSQFIPLAEKTGLIVPISEFVLRKVCETLLKWENGGLTPIRIAVNVSPSLFTEVNLGNCIKNILLETRIDPSYLEIEITEGVMINPDHVLNTLTELKALGIHISLDDFGTGYSSLSHLKRIPLNTIKIDLSFIQDIGKSPEDDAMVKTIIDIAHNLKLNVIAEGIETTEQLDFLYEHRCHEGQGYLFSHPVSPEEIESLIWIQEKE